MLLMTGCGGCRDETPKTAAEKKKEEDEAKKQKPKPNFADARPVIYPGIFQELRAEDEDGPIDFNNLSDEEKEKERERQRRNNIANKTKPGHWVNSHFPLVANNFNASGQFSAQSTDVSGNPVRLKGTDFFTYTERPATLAKGEWKNLETTLFIPQRDNLYASATVKYALKGTAGLDQYSIGFPHGLMKPGQFHMVVLSKEPFAYRYLKALDCIRMPEFVTFGSPMNKVPFYEVVNPKMDQPVPLSRNSLTWTTIAYLVWDDFSPEDLDADQQLALVDWLHFGGQIIVSGPDALEQLSNSFLAEYLPAKFDVSTNLVDEDFKEFNEKWSLALKKNKRRQRLFRVGGDALVGVKWTEHEDSQYIPESSEMVLERHVGRGRIILTRFSINKNSPVTKWQSYPSFFNACFLRKPRRNFTVDGNNAFFKWENDGASPYDPLLGSTLRYVSRDLSPLGSDNFRQVMRRQDEQSTFGGGFGSFQGPDITDESVVESSVGLRNQEDHWHYGGFQHDPQSGVAGWNDFSGIANAARKSLKSAAGIDPPSPDFVLKMLGAYLLVLVPVNWLLFRLIGRVEWAWIAAPLIAIAGAFAVVKMASLDIGFVRSQTQLGFLELQADYPRGHLTEYSALYTSLSTRYAMQLDNPTTLSLPFASEGRRELQSAEKDRSTVRGVRLNRAIDNRLEDYLIQSNFTGMLHTEMMHDSNGAISLSRDASELDNGSSINLSAVGVIHRDDNGRTFVATVGDMGPGESKSLKFEKVDPENLYASWYEKKQFSVSLGTARDVWETNFPSRDSISAAQLKRVENINAEELLDMLASANPEILGQNNNRRLINKSDFEIAYEKLNSKPVELLNLGGMLFAINKKLALGKGEYRMIAFTEDRLSSNELAPKATQLQYMTMVLAHLRRPKLAEPAPDVDHWVDLIVDFDLEFGDEEGEDFEFLDEDEKE
jgi:hypothetical protein